MIEVILEFFRNWPIVGYTLVGIPLVVGCAWFTSSLGA